MTMSALPEIETRGWLNTEADDGCKLADRKDVNRMPGAQEKCYSQKLKMSTCTRGCLRVGAHVWREAHVEGWLVKAGLDRCVSVRGHTGGKVRGMEAGALYALPEIKSWLAGAVLGLRGKKSWEPRSTQRTASH